MSAFARCVCARARARGKSACACTCACAGLPARACMRACACMRARACVRAQVAALMAHPANVALLLPLTAPDRPSPQLITPLPLPWAPLPRSPCGACENKTPTAAARAPAARVSGVCVCARANVCVRSCAQVCARACARVHRSVSRLCFGFAKSHETFHSGTKSTYHA
jgi:hypothetical protein